MVGGWPACRLSQYIFSSGRKLEQKSRVHINLFNHTFFGMAGNLICLMGFGFNCHAGLPDNLLEYNLFYYF